MKYAAAIAILICAIALAIGSRNGVNFWITPDHRGDALMRQKKYAEAAKVYTAPYRIATAKYRNGDFEAAAKTFARVPGAVGAFDRGNAWLMHGQYEQAIASYDRALGFRKNWKEAEDNKALALARKAKMDASSKNREAEQTDAYKPDKVVFDQKGNDKKEDEPKELAEGEVSDEELRASWLRRVQTTPGDFLRAKFAYQAAKEGAK
jgi:Ca-activated chloride channel family protein